MLRKLLSFFRSTDELDAAAQEVVERQERDRVERAARDAFRFASEEDFQAFRRRHGFRRRR